MEHQHYKFELVPLPYSYNALEPYIDTLTMELHHDRHLKTYVDNLNAALAKHPRYHGWSLEQLIVYAEKLPREIRTAVKNNAGGVYNHNFFFRTMQNPKGQIPTDGLAQMVERDFGSLDKFREVFKKQALAVFGSGYAWLALDKRGKLNIIGTANQDTPLELGLNPVMLIDVWEHAYYLKHYNKRADYVDDWFNVCLL